MPGKILGTTLVAQYSVVYSGCINHPVGGTEMSSYAKRKFAEYGQYFAQKWLENETVYREHFATADDYRRYIVRQSWPLVGDHCKRYLRDAFNAELTVSR